MVGEYKTTCAESYSLMTSQQYWRLVSVRASNIL